MIGSLKAHVTEDGEITSTGRWLLEKLDQDADAVFAMARSWVSPTKRFGAEYLSPEDRDACKEVESDIARLHLCVAIEKQAKARALPVVSWTASSRRTLTSSTGT